MYTFEKNDFKRIVSSFEKNMPWYTVNGIYEMEDDLLITIRSKNKNEVVVDPFYTLNKKTFEVKEFPMLLYPDKLKDALNHQLYQNDS